jgi:hypothetical protein
MARIYTASPLGLVPDFLGSKEGESQNPYSRSGDTVGSIFSSKHTILKRSNKGGAISDPLTFGEPSTIHKDDIYNVSTTNILKVLEGYPSMKLKSSDFVYTQDYGVYPNNRLIVCRRFPGPIDDDLTKGGVEPSTTLISWFGEDQNPVDFSFGEKWKETSETLKEVLNEFGKDVGIKAIESSGLGGRLASLGNAIPLPGITQVLQREILTSLGIIGPGASKLPVGDPNLIMESMRRETVSMEQPGSGLTGKISVTVKCKWEQKFIAGVDPTFVYYDILRTVLSFGGSNATFYLGASKLGSGVEKFLEKLRTDPFGLIQEFVSKLQETLKKFLEKVKIYFEKGDVPKDDKPAGIGTLDTDEGDSFTRSLGNFGELLTSVTSFVTYKYKIRIMGIMNYLTGSPSGPWHVTVGNPMRPILSSGDMFTTSVTVKLGPTLSFNDLPSTIECDFKLESARNLGIGEIFGKLSCGQVRVTKPNPNYVAIEDIKKFTDIGKDELPKNLEILSSLDDPSFYNSDDRKGDIEFLRSQGLGIGGELDAFVGGDGENQEDGDPLKESILPSGAVSGDSTNRDPNNPEQTSDEFVPQGRGSFVSPNGQVYIYEFLGGSTETKIIVKDQNGKSVLEESIPNGISGSPAQTREGLLLSAKQMFQ